MGASANPRGGRGYVPFCALGPTTRSNGPSPDLDVQLGRVLESTPSEAPCNLRPLHGNRQARNGAYSLSRSSLTARSSACMAAWMEFSASGARVDVARGVGVAWDRCGGVDPCG
ncbi:hypothetical protein CDL15_Pgr009378 [Punica granatum]|uniref:Uncharacterized protein n=1 Tax=Punica granatum TaxID=22663 RepID=A0A218X048_PUNGR|nr:hypothetical protein CDL15_Pgr009378 [Punica granatum]